MAQRIQRVWFITGSNSGLGKAITQAAIDAGDFVVATGRNYGKLAKAFKASDNVMLQQLDVSQLQTHEAVVDAAVERFGRIDVLVNNAGHGQVGAGEETSESELRNLMEVHFFGPVELTKRVLPIMKKQESGTIFQMSSVGGQIASPGQSAYHASKWAIEGWSESVAAEIKPFGIRMAIVEPGAFRTGVIGSGLYEARLTLPEYDKTVGAVKRNIKRISGKEDGDPAQLAQALRAQLDSNSMPLRIALGGDAIDLIREHNLAVERDLVHLETLSRSLTFDN